MDTTTHPGGDAHVTNPPPHGFTVIVNGRKKVVESEVLTFEQVLNLAYDNHPNPGPNIVFTVTFRNAESRPTKKRSIPPRQAAAAATSFRPIFSRAMSGENNNTQTIPES